MTPGPFAQTQRSDLELVAGMVRGEQAALAELYRRLAPTLLAIGLRILRNRNDAEDVLHDVFLQAWTLASTYSAERASVATWMSVRMRSRSIDRLRRSDGARGIEGGQSLDRWGGSTTLPSWAGETRPVERAYLQLSRVQRQVLELTYFEGLGSAEIAELLGISVGTVKSRIASALSKLRAGLDYPAPQSARGSRPATSPATAG